MTDNEVKAIRTQLGLTQAEFAAQLNKIDPNLRIVSTSVSRWESGKHDPSPHAVAAIDILARRGGVERPGAVPLTASEHLELAAAGFEVDGSPGLAAALRRSTGDGRQSVERVF